VKKLKVKGRGKKQRESKKSEEIQEKFKTENQGFRIGNRQIKGKEGEIAEGKIKLLLPCKHF